MEKLTKVTFSNLEKILYPKLGKRKGDIIKYYITIAPKILPFLSGRALVVNRFPDGVESEGFYGKDSPPGTPEWVKRFITYSEAAKRELEYIVCEDLDTLLWLSNLAALELHIPLSKINELDKPDLVLFDLDPQNPAGLMESTIIARKIRAKLDSYGLDSWVKTSGKRGLHVVAPTIPRHYFEETRAFVHKISLELAEETGLVSSEKGRKKAGTVYIDYPQNGRSRTMVCPYSLRATPEATVSTPICWDELDNVEPQKFNLDTVPARFDPWQDFWKKTGN